MTIRVEEAIARAKQQGVKITKKELAAKMWPGVTEVGQQVNMTNLCSGKTKRIDPEWVKIVCEATGVSAEFLLGMSND